MHGAIVCDSDHSPAIDLNGSAEGNPFLDVELTAQFSYKHRTVEVDGFYDGGGVYRVRFMPDTLGSWRYTTRSNRDELTGVEGAFSCVAPGPDNHGPVRVSDTYHFAYADGTPYKQIGTTCYVWTHQGDELEQQTLETLRSAPFNKMRMCVFPKHYAFNENEPERYPFPCLSRGSSAWRGSFKVDLQAGRAHEYYLTYFGVHQPAQISFHLPEGERYAVTVVDIWNMSATPVEEPVVSGAVLALPGKPYHALILRRAG